MRRSPLVIWAAVSVAWLLAGCGSPGRSAPLAWMRRPAVDLAKSEADAPADNNDGKSARPNPFRRAEPANAVAADDKAKPADAGVRQVSAKTPKDAKPAGKSTTHDAETLKLIEAELRDATPEEREQLFSDLKGLDPPLVRQILRMRRMVRQMGQDPPDRQVAHAGGGASQAARGASLHDANVSGVRHIATSSADPPPAGPRVAPSLAGLGTTSPWGAANPVTVGAPVHHGGVQNASANAFGPAYGGPPAAWPAPSDGRATATMTDVYPHASHYNPQQPGTAAGQPNRAMSEWNSQAGPAGAIAAAPSQFGYTAGALPSITPGQMLPASGTALPQQSSIGMPAAAAGTTAFPPAMNASLGGLPAHGYATLGGAQLPASGPPGAGQYTPRPSAFSPKWHEEIQQLVALAEMEAAQVQLAPGSSEGERRDYIEKQVYLRMLYLMSGQQERALQGIPGIPAAEQEFWQQTFWALANYFDFNSIPDSSDRAAQTVAQLRTAIQRLQETARLEVRNVAFCHKILSYGDYEKFPRDEFSPGQPVLVYAEASNFTSEPTADGQFRTLLRSTLEIYRAGPNGGLVERIAFPATEDLCRNRRSDYFHSYEFTMPPAQKLALGPHVLKLTVEDELSRKVATYTLNFMVK